MGLVLKSQLVVLVSLLFISCGDPLARKLLVFPGKDSCIQSKVDSYLVFKGFRVYPDNYYEREDPKTRVLTSFRISCENGECKISILDFRTNTLTDSTKMAIDSLEKMLAPCANQ